jgi:hypothetical protein
MRKPLGARHISDSLPGEAESVAAKHAALAHRGRVSALLDGAIHDPNLDFIIEPVEDSTVAEFVVAEACHRQPSVST